jgi:hypothetical protein
LLGKQIFETLKPRGRKFVDQFFQVITSLRPAFKLDSVTGEPVFDIGLGELNEVSFSLEEIFKYLEQADMPCLVAIDEFQQITNYPEKNTEALLRSYIQHSKNTIFIFAGSQRHIMETIFFSSSRPFYQSVQLQMLPPIAESSYTEFVVSKFIEANKMISTVHIQAIYRLFDGHTWYLQNMMNEIFSLTESQSEADKEVIIQALKNKLANLGPLFQSTLNLLSERQKEVLIAIAKEHKAKSVTSGAFVKKHALHSASSVQTSVKQLMDREIITWENGEYYVYDRFFGLWLLTQFGTGYRLELNG